MSGLGEYFEQDEPLRVKRKTISVVWNEFNRVLIEENGRLNVYGVTGYFVEIQSMEPHICMLI
mgnify:FL=1